MNQETMQCPYCKETIILGAKKCRYCGEFLEPAVQTGSTQTQTAQNQSSQTQSAPTQNQAPKLRLVYILLGVFFGIFGVNDFYAGYIGRGVAKLLITAFLVWFWGIGWLITEVWSIIEICTVTTDAKGNLLQ